MPLYQVDNKAPKLIGDAHFIAPDANVIGDVVLHPSVSIWFQTTLRAENDRIEIGEGSNIQDGAVLHVDPGFPLSIGKDVSIGHKAMLHGCTIGDASLIGINAVVLNGAVIGKGVLVGANALVTENMHVPDGSLVLGSPAKVIKDLSPEAKAALVMNANHYVKNANTYQQSLSLIDEK